MDYNLEMYIRYETLLENKMKLVKYEYICRHDLKGVDIENNM